MSDRARWRLNGPQVVGETVDGEAIVVNLASGTYYSIRGDGILLWDAILGGSAVDEIVERVSEATAAPAEQADAAVRAFCESLAAEGLIVERETAPEPLPALDLAGGGEGLLAPTFETYSDMQDLVQLDPVHEVDERGWPNAQPTA